LKINNHNIDNLNSPSSTEKKNVKWSNYKIF
jgi:hypothetical protein